MRTSKDMANRKASGNWKKLKKIIAPDSSSSSVRRKSQEHSQQMAARPHKGKGRAVELVEEDAVHEGNNGSARSSASPAPTSLPWFAEDLSPEDLALVRTNSDARRSSLGRPEYTEARGTAGAIRGMSDSLAEDAEAERRKRVILGGSEASSSKDKAELGMYIAIDCEMVGVGPNGSESVLARVSIVNWHGAVLMDTFVRPQERVTDYRTWVSGVRPQDLQGAPVFSDVQQQVADLIKGRVLVGHAIHNDLSALLLSHPRPLIRDTASFQACRDLAKTKHPSLRKLVALQLGIDIQKRGHEHSSVEDARATMALYRTLHADWQKSLVHSGKGAGPAAASRSGKLKGQSNGDTQILYPGWKRKRTSSTASENDRGKVSAKARGHSDDANSSEKVSRGPRRSRQPDDPEWWSKV